MELDDVPAIKEIEARSFPSGWPEEIYRRELRENPNAVYVVARSAPGGAGVTGVPRLGVVGYAGLWMQYDEAHISTLAVHPRFRGRGIGARLLVRLLDEAIQRGAAFATLEVRVSNLVARELYARFGFQETGQRKGYYTDTGEDALIMSTPDLDDPEWARLYRTERRDALR
jgi:ribosomal-protein-alanine N-acetyltransferase